MTAEARAAYNRARPSRSGRSDSRTCSRCGVTWSASYQFHSDAPCTDCRQALRAAGLAEAWRGSPQTPTPPSPPR